MQAVILAAGFGSRLMPLTGNIPKCLVKVCGIPIIEHQIKAMQKHGINKIYIVGGYYCEKLEEFFSEYVGSSITIINNQDYETTNNMYSLSLLSEKLSGEEFILCNGDVVYDEAIISSILDSKLENIIVCDRGRYDIESMKIITNESGFINGISKKYSEEDYFACSIDVYKFSKAGSQKIFDIIKSKVSKGETKDWTEVAIDDLCKADGKLFNPLDICGKSWYEIDNFDDLLCAEQLFSNFDITKYNTFFFDIDGTLSSDGKLFKGVTELLSNLITDNKEVFLITNNTSKSKKDINIKLKDIGLNTDKYKLITPVDGVVSYLKLHNFDRIYCVGTDSLKEEFVMNGLIHDETNPKEVIVGYDTQLTYNKLKKACEFINKGVPYILTHPDSTYPSLKGPIPDVGAIYALIKQTTKKEPKHIFGKPNPLMLQNLFNSKRTVKTSLFIGDRISTDKLLANNLGIDFVCTLTGEASYEQIQGLLPVNWPRFIIKSVLDLNKLVTKLN